MRVENANDPAFRLRCGDVGVVCGGVAEDLADNRTRHLLLLLLLPSLGHSSQAFLLLMLRLRSLLL